MRSDLSTAIIKPVTTLLNYKCFNFYLHVSKINYINIFFIISRVYEAYFFRHDSSEIHMFCW